MTLILTDAQALRPDLFTPANQLSFLPIQDIMSQLDAHFTEPFSLTELATAIRTEKGQGRGQEEKPSIRAQLKQYKDQTAQKEKAAKTRSHELEV